MKTYLEKICDGEDLAFAESYDVFREILAGSFSEIEIAALLAALKAKGESPNEIAGAATALRDGAQPFPKVDGVFADTCGTGGDGAGTVNISTAVALVCAQMGLSIVKHGNRSVSSKCGSADVLERLGVELELSPERAARCLEVVGICFLYAPQYHAGVRHAMPVRRALRTRTIFNLLGPLVNPARPSVQLMGVYDPALGEPIAETLALLGVKRAMVVHGSGLDEIAIHGPTQVTRLDDGAIETFELAPQDVGLECHALEALKGGAPEENARRLRELLSGTGDAAYRDAVAINAGALAHLTGDAASVREGVEHALEVIDSGATQLRLNKFVEVSRGA